MKKLEINEEFPKGNNSARSALNELVTSYLLLTTKRIAFTMAEILLSLTIIGVVAAITLPSLTGNINERTWNTQRKALYARMSQAISLMPAINGYGQIKAESSEGAGDAVDTAAETFITSGLAKVLKINNICTTLSDCGIVSSFKTMAGNSMAMPTNLHKFNGWFSFATAVGKSFSTHNTQAVAFETQNGESLVVFYNQTCKTQYLNEETLTGGGNPCGFPEPTICLNFIYDLNGKKGPNTVGKDIGFITVFNATDSKVVAPMPSAINNAGGASAMYKWSNPTGTSAAKACTIQDSESRLPNIEELTAMMINNKLIDLPSGVYWSGSTYNSSRAWHVNSNVGTQIASGKGNSASVRCVKR